MIFLAKIEQLALLEDYRILTPSQVVAEIEEGKDRPDRVQILRFLERTNVRVEEVEVMDVLPKSLGSGERAAISLAIERNISPILLDDAKQGESLVSMDSIQGDPVDIERSPKERKPLSREG